MYCKECGAEINDKAVICPKCGCPTENYYCKGSGKDEKSFWWGVLGFFLHVVGLVLYLVWMPTYPKRAKSVGLGALIGFIAFVLFQILFLILLDCAFCY